MNNKRNSAYDGALLIIELLRHIPKGRKITASELHEKLNGSLYSRDLRTVQRLLNSLCLQNLGLECDDSSRPYGYSWSNTHQPLVLPLLSPQQSLLLRLTQDHIAKLLPPTVMNSMSSFFYQAKDNLINDKNATLEKEWQKKVAIVDTNQPLLPPDIKDDILEIVSEALYQNKWLSIHYQGASEKKSEGDIMPLALVQQGPRLYLVCRYKDFDDYRLLALHRIQKATMNLKSFTRPVDFDLQSYVDKGHIGWGEGEKIKLRLDITEIAGRHLQETRLSEDQVITNLDDDTLRITATVYENELLHRWIRSFGEDVLAVEIVKIKEST